VSWADAVVFCNELSRAEGLEPVYRIYGDRIKVSWEHNGWRLPTEAEWEYAARAGEEMLYAGGNELDDVGWYAKNSRGQAHAVGQKRPNSWGLYDMSGNVWEWCWDWYGSYSSAKKEAPKGPEEGQERVFRGGSWFNYESFARVAYRNAHQPSFVNPDLGFRAVRAAVEQSR
jgi:formylglycine-generating enzyme